MIELAANDFRSLSDFSQFGRWTDPRWGPLSTSVLTHIRPLTSSKAQVLWQWLSRSTQELSNYLFLPMTLPEPDSLFSSIHHMAVTWDTIFEHQLQSFEPEGDLSVLVFWQETEAIMLPWQLFCHYFADFCLPGEDVEIWPLTEAWACLHYHDNQLIFGRLKAPLSREVHAIPSVPQNIPLNDVIRLIHDNDIVAAIKLYSRKAGVSLKDAKDAVMKIKGEL